MKPINKAYFSRNSWKNRFFAFYVLCFIWRGYGNIRCLVVDPAFDNRAKTLLARKINLKPSLSVIIATAPLECQKKSKVAERTSKNTPFFACNRARAPRALFGAVLRLDLCRALPHLSVHIFTVSEPWKSMILHCFHRGQIVQKIDEKKSIFQRFSKFSKIDEFFEKKCIFYQISFLCRFVSF